jgi:hypothetical protein
VYLGKAEDVTIERLEDVAAALAARDLRASSDVPRKGRKDDASSSSSQFSKSALAFSKRGAAVS